MDYYCGKIAIRSSRQHRTTLPIVEFKCNKMQPTSYKQLWSYIQKENQFRSFSTTYSFGKIVGVSYLALYHVFNKFSVWV